MTTVRTSVNATSLMKAVLPKVVTPLTIGTLPECMTLNVMRPELMDTDPVSRISNLVLGNPDMTQTTGSNQAILEYDSSLGRDTLGFDSDRARFYSYSNPVDYTTAFSMLTVFRADTVGLLSSILGNESVTEANRVGIRTQTNSKIRARVGNGTAQQSGLLSAGNWYGAIMSYNGTNTVSLEVLGEDVVTGAVTNEATITSLTVGSSNPAFGVDGAIDMVGFFTVDLHGTTNSALLSDVKQMIKQFYGNTLVGF